MYGCDDNLLTLGLVEGLASGRGPIFLSQMQGQDVVVSVSLKNGMRMENRNGAE